MKIIFDEDDAMMVAKAMAKSRGMSLNFDRPWAPDSVEDQVHREALRVVAAFREKYGS